MTRKEHGEVSTNTNANITSSASDVRDVRDVRDVYFMNFMNFVSFVSVAFSLPLRDLLAV
mgnify:CR=1 FL=1